MSKFGQIELFDKNKKPAENKKREGILDESGELKKLRWHDKSPDFWRGQEIIKSDKTCSRCEKNIPAGSAVDMTLTFNGPRPKQNDFKNIEYWHKDKRCHQK